MRTEKIEVGTNYKMFRFIKGNRPLVKSKIDNLCKSFKGGLDLFPFCPVLINNENYVIDGQHRLEACKRLKLSVYYMVVPEITLLQIAQLNSVSSRWKTEDFFNCYIECGNKDYIKLRVFREKYSIPISSAISLLMYGSPQAGGGTMETFKQGLFKIKEEEKAEKIMKFVHDYLHISDDGVTTNGDFLRAINTLMNCPLYKHTEVVKKLKDRKSMIEKKSNYKEYIYHIEELFNRGNSKRYIIYEKQKEVK